MYDTFVISMAPGASDIDSSSVSNDLKQTYTNVFSVLINNPFDISAASNVLSSYYTNQVEIINATTPQPTISSNVASQNTVAQLDMDGNIIISSSVAEFSDTKDDVKNTLGSVEKISSTETLVADSINKRAIIIDNATQNIKWEYKSDRYIIDAHLILQNPITLKIDSNILEQETILNKNQLVIWENDLTIANTIYSGDIEDDTLINFDPDLYGDLFYSPSLDQGERWSYKFADVGEFSWFSYPNGSRGNVIVSDNKLSSTNQFIIVESDSLESPFTGRIIKVDCYGNILWTFGNYGYLVAPRDARPLLNNKVLISV